MPAVLGEATQDCGVFVQMSGARALGRLAHARPGHRPVSARSRPRACGALRCLKYRQALTVRRYPDHLISIVPADTALRAGWALTSRDSGPRSGYRYRPRFLAEVWKPGEPSTTTTSTQESSGPP